MKDEALTAIPGDRNKMPLDISKPDPAQPSRSSYRKFGVISVAVFVLIGLGVVIVTMSRLFSTMGNSPYQTIRIGNPGELAAFSPDGQVLGSADNEGVSTQSTLYLWRTADGSLIRRIRARSCTGIAFSTDGSLLGAAGLGGVTIWKVRDGGLLRNLATQDQMFCVAFSPDGKIVASGGADKVVRVWQVEDGKLLFESQIGTWITSLTFSPDQQILVIGCAELRGLVGDGTYWGDASIRILKAANGSLLNKLEGHSFGVLGLRFSMSGGQLASAGGDGIIRLWRFPDGELLASLAPGEGKGAGQSQQEVIRAVAFGPDELVAAGTELDRRIWIWNARDQKLIRKLEGHTDEVLGLIFSSQRNTLISAGKDGTIRHWNLR